MGYIRQYSGCVPGNAVDFTVRLDLNRFTATRERENVETGSDIFYKIVKLNIHLKDPDSGHHFLANVKDRLSALCN